MFCHKCGQQNIGAAFCSRCGEKIALRPETAAPMIPPAAAQATGTIPIPTQPQASQATSASQRKGASPASIVGIVLGSIAIGSLATFGIVTLLGDSRSEEQQSAPGREVERIDPVLAPLWDACDDGDFRACDELFEAAPVGSEEYNFGDTCGARNEPSGWCVDIYGESAPLVAEGEYGSDPYLDLLWDWCSDGDFAACDDLFRSSPVGSTYELFGDTCGLRNESSGWCEDLY